MLLSLKFMVKNPQDNGIRRRVRRVVPHDGISVLIKSSRELPLPPPGEDPVRSRLL